ncbi:MAG: hypothetical protein WCH85_09490 [Methanomicrobiales archaeon]
MGDNEVFVESGEAELLSEIEISSAIQMKDAYPSQSGETIDDGRSLPPSPPAVSPKGDGSAGPNARVYLSKMLTRTPPEEIEKILRKKPDRRAEPGTPDFYTLVLSVSLRLGDPATTRFLNGSIDLALPRGMKILAYSPKAKGTIFAIIENGGESLSLSQGLEISSSVKGTNIQPDPAERRFRIAVGLKETITGTYREKSGYSLAIPSGVLLDYQGMLKNEHDMFWEIFPPMPGQGIESSGKEMQAVISLIVQAPKNTPPKITARIVSRVKGNLWGVITVKGSIVI